MRVKDGVMTMRDRVCVCGVVWACVAVLSASPASAQGEVSEGDAAAEGWGVVPTLGVTLGQEHETLEVALSGGAVLDDARSRWSSRLELGGRYGLGVAPVWGGVLEGQTSLGAGLVYASGDVPVLVRQGAHWARPLGAGFEVSVGGALGVQVNPSMWALSWAQASAPVGLRWGWFEVVYAPGWRVGLGQEREAVFGGERRYGAADGWAWMDVMARVRLEGLAW